MSCFACSLFALYPFLCLLQHLVHHISDCLLLFRGHLFCSPFPSIAAPFRWRIQICVISRRRAATHFFSLRYPRTFRVLPFPCVFEYTESAYSAHFSVTRPFYNVFEYPENFVCYPESIRIPKLWCSLPMMVF